MLRSKQTLGTDSQTQRTHQLIKFSSSNHFKNAQTGNIFDVMKKVHTELEHSNMEHHLTTRKEGEDRKRIKEC